MKAFKCPNRLCALNAECPLSHLIPASEQSIPDEITGEILYFAVCGEMGDTFCDLHKEDLVTISMEDRNQSKTIPGLEHVAEVIEPEVMDPLTATVRCGGLVAMPIATLKEQKRFLYELSEAVQKTKSLNVFTRKDAIHWIFGKHNANAPFEEECKMAHKIQIGGKKEKSLSTMLDYANQGKPGNATVEGTRSREKVEKTLEDRKADWDAVGKDDPNAVDDYWRTT